MGVVSSIENRFITREAFNIYSDCMFMPTWEKFYEHANELINDNSVSILGFLESNCIIGLLVIKQYKDKSAEIKGIAVDPFYRKQGIGQQLIQYSLNNMQISVLFAKTDDDAISFYSHCGFETEELYESFGNSTCKRYKCVLHR